MDYLEDIKSRLGPAPRDFSFWSRYTYLNLPRPGWAKRDEIRKVFECVPHLLAHGTVVWGHTVQANGCLFEKGPYDHPAVVIYCPDTVHPPTPRALAPVAASLFAWKGTQPDDTEERLLADALTDEYSTHFGLSVPESISSFCPSLFSAIFIARRHLPDGKLSLSYYPLLISEDVPGFCMIVPSKFWPEQFIAEWKVAGRRR